MARSMDAGVSGRGKPRILFVVNAEWYFLSHRLPLARQLRARGCDVIVAAAEERGWGHRIRDEGIRFIPLRLNRRSTGGFRELGVFVELFKLYRREQPDLVHHVTIKPVLYGSVAARLARVPAVVNAIPGLGYMFLGAGLAGRLRRTAAKVAYRIALSAANVQVIFQNPEDRDTFVAEGLVRAPQAVIIKGSGVDLTRFHVTEEPCGVPVAVLASRLLWDKGIGELVEASRILQRQGVACRIVLVGEPDPHNPRSVDGDTLTDWQRQHLIEWWGLRADMPEVLSQANLIVLPSYREGVPKALLEAAAAGRAMVATDVPGCREVVRHGITGLLVPPRDADALARAITELAGDPARRRRMGIAARQIAEREFSEGLVVDRTFDVYRTLLGAAWDRLPVSAG